MDDRFEQDSTIFTVNHGPSKDDATWIDSAPTPFEKAARRWESQSRRMMLEPNKATPREIMQERWDEFWSIWEKLGKGVAL